MHYSDGPVNKDYLRAVFSRDNRAQQTSAASATESLPLITATTTMEYVSQRSHRASNMYGLVTLTAPSINRSLSSSNRVP
jgi:hypothetical protein